MSVAENLLLAGGRTPALIDWKKERAALAEFLRSTPFTLDLDATPAGLAAGEKQKLELLKQLYLKPRLLILDEPTSVLTPQEADEVLGLRARGGAARRVHGAHDHAQVPRGDGLRRRGDGAAARPPGARRAGRRRRRRRSSRRR